MKKIYVIGNYGIKVSRKFHAHEFLNGDVKCIGTPADIRKICRILEMIGYYRIFSNKPIMREGRIYSVFFNSYWHVGATYSTHRV